jgi:uncharacterized membrane protein YgcG
MGMLLSASFLLVPLRTSYALETIPAFDAHVTVHANATIEVEERITYDFGDDARDRHGIFRTIPYSYQAGSETYTADVVSVVVTDGSGEPIPFSESRGNGMLTIKIGDPESEVRGFQNYVISYVVEGPFLYFDEYDELYWNVVGAWPKNGIERATVLVDLPVGVQVLKAACYQGPAGSGAACTSDEKLVSEERAGYRAEATFLAPGEGFAISASFPKGAIIETRNPWDAPPASPWKYTPLFLPLLVGLGMLRLWYVRGRDPSGARTIVTQFEPPQDVPPLVAGTLYNERAEPREVSAEILRLAVAGYVRIHRIEEKTLGIFTTTDYLIERLQPEKVPEEPIGALVLEKLFDETYLETKELAGGAVRGALLSNMAHKFTTAHQEIQNRAYEEVVVRGYFPAEPQKVRLRWALVGVGVSVLGFFLLPEVLGIALILSGVVVVLFGFFMPVKTREGVAVLEHLEGFKRYLTVAEKDRLAFHSAPERSPELFDRYLPYAVMFGVEAQWAEQFQDIYGAEPSWYRGGAGHPFAATAFASDLSSFTQTVSTAAMPQASGSGGGGHVGGGFGGGGGGSW